MHRPSRCPADSSGGSPGAFDPMAAQPTNPCRIRPPASRSGHRPALARWLGWLGLLAFATLPLSAEVTKEYQLKAVFLYNFTKFIEWPPERFATVGSPIVIGVLGVNSYGGYLEKIVEGRTVQGRPILVRFLPTAAAVDAVHLLFVPAGEETLLPADGWQHTAIVTVGESPDLAARGGMIVFSQVADRLRFEINLAAAERNGLKISSQLLKLATVVRR